MFLRNFDGDQMIRGIQKTITKIPWKRVRQIVTTGLAFHMFCLSAIAGSVTILLEPDQVPAQQHQLTDHQAVDSLAGETLPTGAGEGEMLPSPRSDSEAPMPEAIEGMPVSSAARTSGFCAEDEYFLLYGNNHHIGIYGSDGTKQGEFVAYSDIRPLTIGTDAIISLLYNGEVVGFSTRTMEPIVSFPENAAFLIPCEDTLLTVETFSGTISLYNSAGTCFYQNTLTDVPLSGERPGGCFMKLDSGYLIGVRFDEVIRWIFVEGQTFQTRELNSSVFRSIEPGWGLYSFGDWLITTKWLDGETVGTVYDLDGNVILEHVDGIVTEECKRYEKLMRHYAGSDKAVYLLKNREDGLTNVFGPSLVLKGSLDLTETDSSFYMTCRNGILEGLPADELGGRICDGFFEYESSPQRMMDNHHYAPYAVLENGYLLYMDGHPVFIPEPEDGSRQEALQIESVNSWYYVSRENGTRVIRRISDGSVFPEEGSVFPDNAVICLSGDSVCVRWLSYVPEYSYQYYAPDDDSIFRFYGPEGNQTWEATGTEIWFEPWRNGYFHIYRGVYEGFCDRYGNWAFRVFRSSLSE